MTSPRSRFTCLNFPVSQNGFSLKKAILVHRVSILIHDSHPYCCADPLSGFPNWFLPPSPYPVSNPSLLIWERGLANRARGRSPGRMAWLELKCLKCTCAILSPHPRKKGKINSLRNEEVCKFLALTRRIKIGKRRLLYVYSSVCTCFSSIIT